MQNIETKRLKLRKLDISDLDDFFSYARKDTVGPNAGWPPHKNKMETLAILKLMIKEEETWAIEYQNIMIGTFSLSNKRYKNSKLKTKEIGYSLDDLYWNLGFATEATKAVLHYAFYELMLDKVIVGHEQTNNRSKRVILKCGFEYAYIDYRYNHEGQLVDVWMYEMNRQQYLEGLKND